MLAVQKECLFATAGDVIAVSEKVYLDLPPSSTFASSRIQICEFWMSDLRVRADFRLQVLDPRFRIPDNRMQIAHQLAQPV